MTSNQKYEALCLMIREHAKTEFSNDFRGAMEFAERVIRDPFKYAHPGNLLPFYNSAAALLVDALTGISEQSTPKTVSSAVKRMLAKDDTRPALQYMHRTEFRGEIRYAVCDGYRALALKHDITCLPHANEGENFLDLNQAMDLEKHEEIKLPTVKDLKATIAAHPELKPMKTKKKPGQPAVLDNRIGVNAIYLLDMLQALPGCRAWMTGNYMHPIFFESDDGDGILCPVRIRADGEKALAGDFSEFGGVHI